MFSPKINLPDKVVHEYYLLIADFEALETKLTFTPTGDISIANSDTGITNASKAIATEVSLYDNEGILVKNVVADVYVRKSEVNGEINILGGVKFRYDREDDSATGYIAFPLSPNNIDFLNVSYSTVTTASNQCNLLKTIMVTYIPMSVANGTPEAIKFTFPADICDFPIISNY